MELEDTPPEDDVLALPIRARLFTALASLRRPATTQELAGAVGRHPNTVRVQLQRLADAALIESRRVRQRRGRPRDVWAVLASAQPGGEPPQAHGDLGRWLARAIGDHGHEPEIERGGREIGRELAPAPNHGSPREAMRDALAALGFAPEAQDRPSGGTRFVLGNCPYRRAVAENPGAVCALHRGITQGLLDRLDPRSHLEDFVARDPFAAGCLIDVAAS